MTTRFKDLLAALPEERRAAINRRSDELLLELALQELRQARALSQEELGRALNINQASVSKLERRTDMYISTLRRFVEAMGGELEITARFPEARVRITQFGDLK
jgi:transcriptional regulator with XRE-family HTH domain